MPIKQPPSQYEQSRCKLLAVVIQEQTIYNFAIFFLRKKKRKCYLWQFSSVRIFFAAAACVTLPANQKALDCATGRRGLFFFLLLLLLPNVMQSTTAVATLGDFSWHRQTKALFFWSLEMLFWAHAPPMLTQIWPKEAARLFTDPARCRKISPVWRNSREHDATRRAMTDMSGGWGGKTWNS